MSTIQRFVPPIENLGLEVPNASGSDIAPRSVVVVNGRAFITIGGIPNGITATVERAGGFRVPALTGTAFAQGDPLYWDAGNTRVTNLAVDSSNVPLPYLGRCRAAKASGIAIAEVDIDQPMRVPRRIVRTVTNAEAAANGTNGQVDIVTGVISSTASQRCTVEVRTATSGRVKTGYDVNDVSLTPGTIRVAGVGSGTQIDENDVVIVTVHPEG